MSAFHPTATEERTSQIVCLVPKPAFVCPETSGSDWPVEEWSGGRLLAATACFG